MAKDWENLVADPVEPTPSPEQGMSQEKLEQRAIAICSYAKRLPESHSPSPIAVCIVCHHAILLARAELQKAAEIADEMGAANIGDVIRELME
jgi:hypothetical protein